VDTTKSGILFVDVTPGYKGITDMMEEALFYWKPGRRRNEDLSVYRYPARGGVPQHVDH